jgi:hypothetical protein
LRSFANGQREDAERASRGEPPVRSASRGEAIAVVSTKLRLMAASVPHLVVAALALGRLPRAGWAQRPAVLDDFPGITQCEGGRAVSRIRADVQDPLLRAQLEAHEAVHREQAGAFATCEAFLAGLTSARRIIDVELPAYCAQWRVAVSQGADPVETRREFAWRIAAQSGAMENRLQVVQRFELECDLVPAPGLNDATARDRTP